MFFTFLDAPVRVIKVENMPAIPLNSTLEATMLPNADKVGKAMGGSFKILNCINWSYYVWFKASDWSALNIVEKNIEEILTDHAYCEQKAASNAN